MKTKTLIVLICIVLSLLTLSFIKPSTDNSDKHYRVTLYSGEKVVASWNALAPVQVENGTLTFYVITEMAMNTRQVRICGTYWIEEL